MGTVLALLGIVALSVAASWLARRSGAPWAVSIGVAVVPLVLAVAMLITRSDREPPVIERVPTTSPR